MSLINRLQANPVLAVVVLCFGGLCASLTQTMVIPIQGDLPEMLSTSAANASWVVTATLLGGAVAMPVAGRLADMFGKKRLILVNALLLAVGSAVCAVSDTLIPMLAGRAMQGLAMGFIPVGISMIREVAPPKMAGTAVAAMSATLGVGGAIGLPLSAWIVEQGDWHALFWVSTAVALVVVVSVAMFLPQVEDAHPGRFDLVGAVGIAAALLTFLIGLSKATSWGWDDSRTWGCIVVGVLIAVVWGFYELRTTDPLVDLRATAQLPVLMTNLAAIAIGFGMMAQAIVVPQLLEMPAATGYGLDQTILQAGLWMAPQGLMMLVFAPVSSRMMSTIGAKKTLMIGATVLGFGYVFMFFMMGEPWQLTLASCVAGAGVGIGYAAMPTLIMDNSPVREAASAVSVNTLMRSVGTTVASAVMVTLMTSSTMDLGGTAVPTESGFELCFAAGAIAALVGAMIAGFIPTLRSRSGDDPDRPTDDEPLAVGAR